MSDAEDDAFGTGPHPDVDPPSAFIVFDMIQADPEGFRRGFKAAAVQLAKPKVDAEVARVLRERREAAEATQREAEVAEKLAQIEALGADKLPDKTVVAFDKTLSGKAYSYAAIKTDGKWYLTGRLCGDMTNDEFCVWLLSGEGFTNWEVLRPRTS